MTYAVKDAGAPRPNPTSKPLHVHDGTLEGLKWLALALMTADHVNKYLFAETLTGVYELGRLALPLFGFVLAYNLARPGALTSGAYQRTIVRLAIYGVAATPFFIMLGGLLFGWWPLNILFMLLVATGSLYLAQQDSTAKKLAGLAVFVIGGAFVEFWWFGVLYCMCAHWYCQTTNRKALLMWMLSAFSLTAINGNFWAVAAIPLIIGFARIDLKIKKHQLIFYAFYPIHLAAILPIKAVFFNG